MARTSASPSAASVAAIAMVNKVNSGPCISSGFGLKCQNAIRFKLAAFSIISRQINMMMICRRVSAPTKPIEKRMAERIRK